MNEDVSEHEKPLKLYYVVCGGGVVSMYSNLPAKIMWKGKLHAIVRPAHCEHKALSAERNENDDICWL